MIAGREKDWEFLTSALASDLINIAGLLERLELAFGKVENDVIPDRIDRFIRHLKHTRFHHEIVNTLRDFKRAHF